MSLPPLFNVLHHVCIVVRDLERAVAYYERLGFGPWFDYPKGAPYVEFDVPNEAASNAMRQAVEREFGWPAVRVPQLGEAVAL